MNSRTKKILIGTGIFLVSSFVLLLAFKTYRYHSTYVPHVPYKNPELIMDIVDNPWATVVDYHLFYNNSSYDGNSSDAGVEDDDAIAPDKTPLLPQNTSTYANVSNYSKGINGIMIDVYNLPSGTTLTVDDFIFCTGITDEPATWGNAPPPSSITIRTGQGTNGSDRVTIIWDAEVVQWTWLKVEMKANPRTGLLVSDVHYWGSMTGDVGNSTTAYVTDFVDLQLQFGRVFQAATITDPYDINRSGAIDFTDLQLAFTYIFKSIPVISVPEHPRQLNDVSVIQNAIPPGGELVEGDPETLPFETKLTSDDDEFTTAVALINQRADGGTIYIKGKVLLKSAVNFTKAASLVGIPGTNAEIQFVGSSASISWNSGWDAVSPSWSASQVEISDTLPFSNYIAVATGTLSVGDWFFAWSDDTIKGVTYNNYASSPSGLNCPGELHQVKEIRRKSSNGLLDYVYFDDYIVDALTTVGGNAPRLIELDMLRNITVRDLIFSFYGGTKVAQFSTGNSTSTVTTTLDGTITTPHQLQANDRVRFASTGAMATGISTTSSSSQYYVKEILGASQRSTQTGTGGGSAFLSDGQTFTTTTSHSFAEGDIVRVSYTGSVPKYKYPDGTYTYALKTTEDFYIDYETTTTFKLKAISSGVATGTRESITFQNLTSTDMMSKTYTFKPRPCRFSVSTTSGGAALSWSNGLSANVYLPTCKTIPITSALSFRKCDGILVENCLWKSPAPNEIQVSYCANVNITNCNFENFQGFDSADGYAVVVGPVNGLTFNDSTVRGARHAFTTMGHSPGQGDYENYRYGTPRNVTVDNVTASMTGSSVSSLVAFDTHGEGWGVSFQNCTAIVPTEVSQSNDPSVRTSARNGNCGFQTRSRNTSFRNCTVIGENDVTGTLDLVATGTQPAVYPSLNAIGFRVYADDATIANCDVSNCLYGVRVLKSGSDTESTDNAKIVGCVFTNISHDGILFDDGVSHTVAHCTFTDVSYSERGKRSYIAILEDVIPTKTITSVDAATGIWTVSGGHGFATGDKVELTTTVDLPSRFYENFPYYVIKIDSTTFKLAGGLTAAYNGRDINLTNVGGPSPSGTHTVKVPDYQILHNTLDRKFNQYAIYGATYTANNIRIVGNSMTGYTDYYPTLSGGGLADATYDRIFHRWAVHGLQNGEAIMFKTLPASMSSVVVDSGDPFAEDTIYYVRRTDIDPKTTAQGIALNRSDNVTAITFTGDATGTDTAYWTPATDSGIALNNTDYAAIEAEAVANNLTD